MYIDMIIYILQNGTVGDAGLIYGNWWHFVVQTVGIIVIFVFEFGMGLILWYLVLDILIVNKCRRNKHNQIRNLALNTYLGIPMWEIDMNLAFADILKSESDMAKTMLLEFHCDCLRKKEEADDEKDEILLDDDPDISQKMIDEMNDVLGIILYALYSYFVCYFCYYS